MKTLRFVGAYSDKHRAEKAATENGSILLTASSEATSHLPFAALVLKITDQIEDFVADADIGAYLVCERTIKNEPLSVLTRQTQPGVVGIFTLVANPTLGARDSDRHWRDHHAPLALEVHRAMTHYYQLSVLQTLKGPHWNGFALCCFDSEHDLRHRFFHTLEGEKAIGEDVSYFADTHRSPRRVIATMRHKPE